MGEKFWRIIYNNSQIVERKYFLISTMLNPEIILLQKKIADYPEKIDSLQKRYAMAIAPKANEIGSAIKGLNAYMLQLKVCKNSFAKLYESVKADNDKLEMLIDQANAQGEDVTQSLQLSHVQIQHAQATLETYLKSIDAQMDGASVAKDKLGLAQKQKKTFDVVNLLAMIEKGDGYQL